MKRKPIRLNFTHRALRDLEDILDFSRAHWGRKVGEKYFDDLEAGIQRIEANPALLTANPEFHPALRFYRVNKHLFVCDVQEPSIVVLTVLHASMDIPRHLAELEPTLAAEVELLHRRFRKT